MSLKYPFMSESFISKSEIFTRIVWRLRSLQPCAYDCKTKQPLNDWQSYHMDSVWSRMIYKMKQKQALSKDPFRFIIKINKKQQFLLKQISTKGSRRRIQKEKRPDWETSRWFNSWKRLMTKFSRDFEETVPFQRQF